MSKLSKNYILYTYFIMGVCWGVCLVCSLAGISFKDNYLLYVLYLLGGWSPIIASFISLKKTNRIINIREWLKNVFDFKHNILSYIMVIIFGILLIVPQCLISGYENGAPLIGGGLEEAGWHYILQPELEKK